MNLKRLAAMAAIAVGVGISGLTSGLGLVNAAPLDPLPPAPGFQPDPVGPAPGIPAEKCWRYGRTGPGNGQAGGGVPLYPPPCKGHY
jgi:hypothetical protein